MRMRLHVRMNAFSDMQDPQASDWAKTNVHLAGLLDARIWTEADLRRFAQEDGAVQSVKIVLDRSGQPRGTGFVRFSTTGEAARFIDRANAQGLAASFARPSYKTALSARQDEASSNIYLANMPTHWTTQDVIENLLPPPLIVHSVRILYEGDKPGRHASQEHQGRSRGVGFARMDTREMANQAIEAINGRVLPGWTMPLQARFADSDAQRHFKRQSRPPQLATIPAQAPPLAAPLVGPPAFWPMASTSAAFDLPRSPSTMLYMPPSARRTAYPSLPAPPMPPDFANLSFSPTAPAFLPGPAKTALGMSSSAPTVPRSGSSGSLRRSASFDSLRPWS